MSQIRARQTIRNVFRGQDWGRYSMNKIKYLLLNINFKFSGGELDRHQPVYAKRPDFSRDVRFQ